MKKLIEKYIKRILIDYPEEDKLYMDNKAKKKYCDCTASLGDREIIIDFCNRCFGKIR